MLFSEGTIAHLCLEINVPVQYYAFSLQSGFNSSKTKLQGKCQDTWWQLASMVQITSLRLETEPQLVPAVAVG